VLLVWLLLLLLLLLHLHALRYQTLLLLPVQLLLHCKTNQSIHQSISLSSNRLQSNSMDRNIRRSFRVG
jgi:hypothetical protein